MIFPSSIPSPPQGVWHLGPVPIRAYALCILAGIGVAIWLGERRRKARGSAPGVVESVSVWMVPFGIVGGRLYHVITDPELYFTAGRNPWNAFKIWEGVAFAVGSERFRHAWPLPVGTGQPVVNVDKVDGHTQRDETVRLGDQVLLVCGDPTRSR
jgi:hypothetical protein